MRFLKTRKTRLVLMALKYLFPVGLALFCALSHGQSALYVLSAFLHVLAIALFANLLYGKQKYVAQIVSTLFLLILNAQFLVLYFGNTFVIMAMLSNVEMIGDIGGSAKAYAVGIVIMALFTFLPMTGIDLSKRWKKVSLGLFAALLSLVLLVLACGLGLSAYSPYCSLYDLGVQQYNRVQTRKATQALLEEYAAQAAAQAALEAEEEADDEDEDDAYGISVAAAQMQEADGDAAEVTDAGDVADEDEAEEAAQADETDADADEAAVAADTTETAAETETVATTTTTYTSLKDEFYQSGVTDYYTKPSALSSKPNVILIFVEGFSYDIIYDERDITPNVRSIAAQSISFTNYYNHTFATYFGLSGQLYSGYQQDLYDANYLVSLQSIFKQYGYTTTFINVEPGVTVFSNFLKTFGFDTLLEDSSKLDGITTGTMSDKTAYETLYDTAISLNSAGTPFFLSMYSFGTHATLDGLYNQYGDGSVAELNKFYDMDVQLGTFFEKFKNSALYDNTVLIITSDHATYIDAGYSEGFPDSTRTVLQTDEIPLLIYYKGVSATQVNVSGRNSLDLTPTILDFLDMSGENYFLGQSLFAPLSAANAYETLYEEYGTHRDTSGGYIHSLDSTTDAWFSAQLIKYFAAKLMQ